MSRIGIVAALAVVALATAGDAEEGRAAAGRRPKSYTIEQFMTTTSVSGASFSPDESKVLLSSNVSGIFNAYTVPVAGGEPAPVTKSTTDSTFAVAYFPKDDRILYTHDQGGNENNHLYLRTKDGDED